MCGIGGILRRDGGEIPEQWIDRIDRRIAYRGPDGSGVFHDRVETTIDGEPRNIEVALIHRRLSILDHEGGGQPMVSKRGRSDDEGLVALVFNGCIYNHRALRDELQDNGHEFRSDHSDTEVIIHAYRQWGAGFEEHLEGMYAFGLWDRANARLVLSRDLFGEKPLYIQWHVPGCEDALAFSSDAYGLADMRGRTNNLLQSHTPDRDQWLSTYLQLGYNWQGRTIFVNSSRKGADVDDHHAAVVAAPPAIIADSERYIPRKPRRETTQAEFESLLDDAVAERLEADVPLGCFLSGGVDSSLLAALATRHVDALQTFTVRMPDDRYDESAHAERVAAHLGTVHHTLDVAVDPAADLVHLVRTLGQPFGDSSILPTYWVSRASREHVKVALSGDGADELFFGYDRYMHARRLNRHQRLFKWLPRKLLQNAHPKSMRYKLGRLGEIARDYRLLGVLAMESIFTQRRIEDLLGFPPPARATCDPGFDPMLSLRNIDLLSYLPNDLLTKVDTASMAVSLEVRAPYLDSKVVNAALNCPTWVLAPDGRRKGLLRDIASKYLPKEVIDRPKMGFAIPIGRWFRDDFGGMQSLLLHYLQPFRHDAVPLQQHAIDQLIREHISGDVDHGQRLFALLTLAIAIEHACDHQIDDK